MSQENEEMIRKGYEALSQRNVDGWLEMVHVDAELHELAEVPDTAVYRGHDELRRWADSAMELVEEWQWTPEEFIHETNAAMVVRVRLTARGRSSGAPIRQVVFHVIELRDDKAATIRGFLDRAQALEAVGLRE